MLHLSTCTVQHNESSAVACKVFNNLAEAKTAKSIEMQVQLACLMDTWLSISPTFSFLIMKQTPGLWI